MKKRVVFVHGWDGSPEGGWFLWLKKELLSKGFAVIGPQLPKADEPRIENWIPALAQAVGTPDDETYFIGHSMGCQAIARYLESLPENVRVGGAVFVAGFFKRLTGLEDDAAVRDVSQEWLTTPLDLRNVRVHLPRSIAIFSDNDPYVPPENQGDFREKLESEIVIRERMGHFTQGEDGVDKLPVVLESLLKLAQK